MIQTAVMIRVNGNLCEKVFTHIPDYNDAIKTCNDCGYVKSDSRYDGDFLRVEYEQLMIGEREKDTGWLLDSEFLCHLYDDAEYEKNFEDAGYKVDIIQTGSYSIDFTELEE
jgi:hypothetical protein